MGEGSKTCNYFRLLGGGGSEALMGEPPVGMGPEVILVGMSSSATTFPSSSLRDIQKCHNLS